MLPGKYSCDIVFSPVFLSALQLCRIISISSVVYSRKAAKLHFCNPMTLLMQFSCNSAVFPGQLPFFRILKWMAKRPLEISLPLRFEKEEPMLCDWTDCSKSETVFSVPNQNIGNDGPPCAGFFIGKDNDMILNFNANGHHQAAHRARKGTLWRILAPPSP